MEIDTTVMLAKTCTVEIFGSVWSNQTHDDIERFDLSIGYFCMWSCSEASTYSRNASFYELMKK